MKVLIIAEHDNKNLNENILNVVYAAKKISKNIDIFIAGYKANNIINISSKIENISNILYIENKKFTYLLSEDVTEEIFKISKNYTHIMCSTTSFGKNILPRLAAKLNVNQISEVIKIKNFNTFKRPIYTGNIISTIKSKDFIKIITIRAISFKKAKFKKKNSNFNTKIKIINTINKKFKNSKFISKKINKTNRPNLNTAKIIIAGGNGIKSKENFKLLELLADKLKAAIGATRSAVDSGYISNEFQIGQSGQIVAPELYIAIGISGAIQHLAGIKDSKKIIAINKDKDAPIFSIADYGIIGDLNKIIPNLINKIN
ncbi:electron transfer flavoprotein subunit alpha/FixB family protein [Candidatus Zinderia endosymbiont of Aphrophora alni]|uniref:electron transfer flavoprotein subunit alpha/FixB family protein n=1 Tax=Candidatus Zinderia endosymbiont of Aphrophora alni TaxID=3077951 RepID=UPI0030D25A4A